jgi:hypothetical protein
MLPEDQNTRLRCWQETKRNLRMKMLLKIASPLALIAFGHYQMSLYRLPVFQPHGDVTYFNNHKPS